MHQDISSISEWNDSLRHTLRVRLHLLVLHGCRKCPTSGTCWTQQQPKVKRLELSPFHPWGIIRTLPYELTEKHKSSKTWFVFWTDNQYVILTRLTHSWGLKHEAWTSCEPSYAWNWEISFRWYSLTDLMKVDWGYSQLRIWFGCVHMYPIWVSLGYYSSFKGFAGLLLWSFLILSGFLHTNKSKQATYERRACVETIQQQPLSLTCPFYLFVGFRRLIAMKERSDSITQGH